jgi:hypothetical protein
MYSNNTLGDGALLDSIFENHDYIYTTIHPALDSFENPQIMNLKNHPDNHQGSVSVFLQNTQHPVPL